MSTFRFIHVADTHVGHGGNSSIHHEYEPLRVSREDDFLDAFQQVIDLAIVHRVDAVLHAGDGTDKWGYKEPKVINGYVGQVTRLHEHQIPYLEIVGNHNLPKKGRVGCYLEALGKYPGVTTVYKGFYEAIELVPGVVVHCVPSTFTQELLDEALSEVKPIKDKINIGMGHFGVTSIKHYAENAHNSLVVDLDRLIGCNMDYFALGDYHDTTDFGNHIWYPGSTERMGFGEMQNKPKVLLVEIDSETHQVNVTPLYLSARPMIEIEEVDAAGKDITELNQILVNKIEQTDIQDKIVRMRIRNVPAHLKSLIDEQQIRKLTEGKALYFKIEYLDKINKSKDVRTSGQKLEGVLEGWGGFVEALAEDGSFNKEDLRQEGQKRLAEVLEYAIT